MKFTFTFYGQTRIDAESTLYGGDDAKRAQELANEMAAQLNANHMTVDAVCGGKPAKAIITSPWKGYCANTNPHGWGVPRFHLYAVASYRLEYK